MSKNLIKEDDMEYQKAEQSPREKQREQNRKELMQCSASKYRSFLDTVQLDLCGNRELKHFLANQKRKDDGLTLRNFIVMADAQEQTFKETNE